MSRKGVNRFPELIPRAKPIDIPPPPVIPQVIPQVVPQVVDVLPKASKLKTLDELKTKMHMIETKLDLLLKDPEPKLNDDPKIEFKEVEDNKDLISTAKTLARAKSKGIKVPSDLPPGAEFRVGSGSLLEEALKLKYKKKKNKS